ncbi:MAG: ATP-dependent RecD-like DNA helicase [Armatimonadota bacterium]
MSQHAEHISGLVERVTFHSTESGFAVLRVKARGHRELVTVVGTVPSVAVGEWIEATGMWRIDSQYGQQLRANVLRTTPPATPEGIAKYLGSGLIKGIGPHFADKLVQAFGMEVFEVIEQSPERMLEVEGIGARRQQRILAAWHEQKAVREVMVFLHSHGVGTSRAFRIYKVYGDDAIQKVQEDPYRLARDIWGVGFKTADQIAASLGIDKQSDLRARAGVEYVLQALTEEGHCAYARHLLVEKATEMLEIAPLIVEHAIEHGLAEARLVARTRSDGSVLIYLAALDACERQLARNLVALSRMPHPCPPVDPAKVAAWAQATLGLELAPAQQEALAQVTRSKVMVITGGPGVGKTTLVRAIVRLFHTRHLRVVLCAPTGRAARRLGEAAGAEASTIHRLMEFDPATARFKHDADYPLRGDVFVIDEMSMVDLVLAHQLVRAIPPHAIVVMVGDVDQLPSVGPGSVLRDIIDSGVLPVCRLTHIFRQSAESEIVMNAHRVNQGQMPRWDPTRAPTSTDFHFLEVAEPVEAVARVRRLVQEQIPKRFGFDPLEDIQVLTPMQRGELGARNLNQVLQAALNPSGREVQRFGWTFRVGDKVMQIINDYDKDVFNGDIGRIVAIDEEDQEVEVRFDERSVTYDFGELDELVLAYASTVHKAQGSEYPCVVLPVHTQHYMLLYRDLLYTAITRARKLLVMVGTKRAIATATHRVGSRTRVTTLQERLQDEGGR